MSNIFHSKRVSLLISIIVIIISNSKSNTNYKDLLIEEEEFRQMFDGNQFFKIDYKHKNDTKFIRVQITGNDDEEKEYIIKYLKNDINKIDQLSKSYENKAIMWLKQEQINQGFYLGLECKEKSCNYNLEIEPKEIIELEPGDTYSYYVNEDTLNMNFSITADPNIYKHIISIGSYKVTIWAKGYKKLNSDLYGPLDNENENKEYNTYIQTIKNKENFILNVNGTQGDLINVGVLIFRSFDFSNYCLIPIQSFKGEEINGKFGSKKNVEECFEFKDVEKDKNIFLEYESSISSEVRFIGGLDNYHCLIKEINNDFYSFNFIKNKNKINMLNLLSNVNYKIIMKKEEKIGLIPLEMDKSNYFTYQIKDSLGVYKSSILTLKDYPFYNISNEKIEQAPSLFTYIKKEYQEVSSPIGPNQKMLLIECESQSCSINVTLYDDNNKISIEQLKPFYNYIRKDTHNSLQLNLISKGTYFLFIDPLMGTFDEFKVELKDAKKSEYNNQIYEIETNDTNNQINLNLSSTNNVVYSLAAIDVENNSSGLIKANIIANMYYMFKINDETKKSEINLVNINKDKIYYLSISPKTCDINLSFSLAKNIKLKKRSYGFFYKENYGNQLIVDYEKENTNCKFYISFFEYKNENNELNYIILPKYNPHTFFFASDHKQVKYKFFLNEKDKDLTVDIKLNNIKETKIEINLNDFILFNDTINTNQALDIKSKDLEDNCKDDYKPCYINISITLEKSLGEENTEISIYEKKEEDSKKKKYLIFTVVGGGILFLIIIVIIICSCKNKKSYEQFKQEINTISFKQDEDNKRESNDNEDDLLE